MCTASIPFFITHKKPPLFVNGYKNYTRKQYKGKEWLKTIPPKGEGLYPALWKLTLNSVTYPKNSMATESIMEDCDSTRHFNCKVRSDAGGYDWIKCPFSGKTAAQIREALA